MTKLIACSLGALLLAAVISTASAQSIPQGMPQNLQQLQSGQLGQQNSQSSQNGQFNQQSQNGQQGQNGQMGQNGQNGQNNQQASNGSKKQKQPKLTKEQKMIQQYVPQQYQGYLPAGVTGRGRRWHGRRRRHVAIRDGMFVKTSGVASASAATS